MANPPEATLCGTSASTRSACGKIWCFPKGCAKLFPHDPHAGADGTYRVTSLYFDTPYDSALREKLDGVNRREKFRLRYYGARYLLYPAGEESSRRTACAESAAPA